MRIYSDGKLVAEGPSGMLPEAVRGPEKAVLLSGKDDRVYRSEFRIAAIRISGKALAPAEMALAAGKASLPLPGGTARLLWDE